MQVLLELSPALCAVLAIVVKNPRLSHSLFYILSRYVKRYNEKFTLSVYKFDKTWYTLSEQRRCTIW
nr:MAG TPA: hypothetical protein [Caudoviricetes sp.]